MKKADDGEIILLLDTNEATVNAVLRAIPELQEQGYEFVRVDDLLTRQRFLKIHSIYHRYRLILVRF